MKKTKKQHRRDSKKQFLIRSTTGLILILFFCSLLFLFPPFALSAFLGAALLVIFFVEWPRLFPKKPKGKKKTINLANKTGLLLFPLYPTISVVFAILLNQNLEYRKLLFYMAILVAIFDVGSYAFGSLLGKNKIAPSISPRKTWEGALGGYLLVTGTLIFLFNRVGTQTSIIGGTLLISLFICSLALSGDLLESFLKRKAGIKDSANFLPGHGGFMDRFDGMFLLVPFFYFFKEFLGSLFGLV